MNSRRKIARLALFIFALILCIVIVAVIDRSESAERNELIVKFTGWTNIVRPQVRGTVYAAFGPCALLAITNTHPTKRIELFYGTKVEYLKDGLWTEIARGTKQTWLIQGKKWLPGTGRNIPVRILEELPKNCPWRVRLNYSLTLPKPLRTVNDWWKRSTPFKWRIFPTREHSITSSFIPAPITQDTRDALPPQSTLPDSKERI